MAQSSAKYTPGEDPAAAFRAGSARGVGLAAEFILEASRRQVPHETGVLERSGTAGVIDGRGEVRGAVSYDTPYAVEQHERTDYRHKKGRKAKYLEDPLNARRGQVLKIIAAELRGEL